jgi:hypothetical protein
MTDDEARHKADLFEESKGDNRVSIDYLFTMPIQNF